MPKVIPKVIPKEHSLQAHIYIDIIRQMIKE
jgi:hypothetical protein